MPHPRRWGDVGREIVEPAASAAVAAEEADDGVRLVRQFREAARRPLPELAARTVEEGEEPLAAAQRELAEEPRLQARFWRPGHVGFVSPGSSRGESTSSSPRAASQRTRAPTRASQSSWSAGRAPRSPAGWARWKTAKTLAGLPFLFRRAGTAETTS